MSELKEFKKVSDKITDFYNEVLSKFDPLMFTSIIGSFVDMYEYDHEDTFDGADCLKMILEVRDGVREEVENFEKELLDNITVVDLLRYIAGSND